MNNDSNDPRGGAREGAGRPTKYDEKMITMKAYVPPSYKERIREIGDGKLSEGVRRLLEHYEQTHD